MRKGDRREDGWVYDGWQWRSPATARRRALTVCIGQARTRAKETGVPFDLTLDYVDELLIATPECPILRVPLVRGDGGGRDNSPSLDRKIPELGYVPGNVQFISNAANRLKGTLTVPEVERLLDYMRSHT